MVNDKDKLSKDKCLILVLNGLDYTMCGTFSEKKEYFDYKDGKLTNLSDKQKQEMNILTLLEEIGYPMEEIGTYFYKNMIVKVIEYLETLDNNNINDYQKLILQLKNYYSQFYLEVAKNELGIGIKPFHSFVTKAVSKIDYTKADSTLLYQIYSNFSEDMDYGEQALVLGSFILGKIEPKRPFNPMIKKLTKKTKVENKIQ